MSPYFWRLCCLSLAALFLVQLSTGLIIRSIAPRLVRWAGRFNPARSASLMLLLRWLPGLFGMFVAAFLCVPSYLRLEPVLSPVSNPSSVC